MRAQAIYVPHVLTARGRAAAQKFKLGVPIRDMRLLDPNLLTSETGKVLVRDNAIVFSMEHARLLITADCVIIPMSGFDHSPLAQHFSTLLEEHITEAAHEAQARRAAAPPWLPGRSQPPPLLLLGLARSAGALWLRAGAALAGQPCGGAARAQAVQARDFAAGRTERCEDAAEQDDVSDDSSGAAGGRGSRSGGLHGCAPGGLACARRGLPVRCKAPRDRRVGIRLIEAPGRVACAQGSSREHLPDV